MVLVTSVASEVVEHVTQPCLLVCYLCGCGVRCILDIIYVVVDSDISIKNHTDNTLTNTDMDEI